jgi:hypothetical protein
MWRGPYISTHELPRLTRPRVPPPPTARRARSKADFIYKLGNAIEDADESALWLEILMEADIWTAAPSSSCGRKQTS